MPKVSYSIRVDEEILNSFKDYLEINGIKPSFAWERSMQLYLSACESLSEEVRD